MSTIRIACQTYTWEMLGDGWKGRAADLLDWIADAGYAGIEITHTMIGEFADHPGEFAAELAGRGLSLAAFAYASPSGFTDPEWAQEDLREARRWIEFVRLSPTPRLGLGGAAHPTRENATQKLDRAIAFYNEAGRMGAEAGVSVTVHPHSHYGSLLESAEKYGYLMAHLDPHFASLGPDTGHIARGGQDVLECLRTHLPRITHLHLKDVTASGEWAPLGEGICDFPAAIGLLESAGYDGWLVAEEESEAARRDSVEAIRRNRQYLRSLDY